MSESASPNNGAPQKRARARKSTPKKKTAPAEQTAEQAAAPAQSQPLRSEAARSGPPRSEAPRPEVPRSGPLRSEVVLTALDRRTMIATAAYYRAERRQFASGHELEDWLAAEADVDASVRKQVENARRNAQTA